jgi:hypothetical protein
MSDAAIPSHSGLRFWLTFGFAVLSLAAVIQIAEPRLSYKHHDGPFSRAFSSDFDIRTNEVQLSLRGISVTLHDTEPYVTFAGG